MVFRLSVIPNVFARVPYELVSWIFFGQIRTFQGPYETKDPNISRVHLVLDDVYLLRLVLIPLVRDRQDCRKWRSKSRVPSARFPHYGRH